MSSEQHGVVVWVLYPLEHCSESRLLLWVSSWRPRDRARASSSQASISSPGCRWEERQRSHQGHESPVGGPQGLSTYLFDWEPGYHS